MMEKVLTKASGWARTYVRQVYARRGRTFRSAVAEDAADQSGCGPAGGGYVSESSSLTTYSWPGVGGAGRRAARTRAAARAAKSARSPAATEKWKRATPRLLEVRSPSQTSTSVSVGLARATSSQDNTNAATSRKAALLSASRCSGDSKLRCARSTDVACREMACCNVRGSLDSPSPVCSAPTGGAGKVRRRHGGRTSAGGGGTGWAGGKGGGPTGGGAAANGLGAVTPTGEASPAVPGGAGWVTSGRGACAGSAAGGGGTCCKLAGGGGSPSWPSSAHNASRAVRIM